MDLVPTLRAAPPVDHDIDHLGRPAPRQHDPLDQQPHDGPAIRPRRRVRLPQRRQVGRQRPDPLPIRRRQVPRLLGRNRA